MATETHAVSAEAGPSTEEILIGLLTGAWATQAVAAPPAPRTAARSSPATSFRPFQRAPTCTS